MKDRCEGLRVFYFGGTHTMMQDCPFPCFLLPDVSFGVYNESEVKVFFREKEEKAEKEEWCPLHELKLQAKRKSIDFCHFDDGKDFDGLGYNFSFRNGVKRKGSLFRRVKEETPEKYAKGVESCRRFLSQKYKLTEVVETGAGDDCYFDFIIVKKGKYCAVSQNYDNASCAGEQLKICSTPWYDSFKEVWENLSDSCKRDFAKHIFYPRIASHFDSSYELNSPLSSFDSDIDSGDD